VDNFNTTLLNIDRQHSLPNLMKFCLTILKLQ